MTCSAHTYVLPFSFNQCTPELQSPTSRNGSASRASAAWIKASRCPPSRRYEVHAAAEAELAKVRIEPADVMFHGRGQWRVRISAVRQKAAIPFCLFGFVVQHAGS